MKLEPCKLRYPKKVKGAFLSECKNVLKKLIEAEIYPPRVKILVDEPGKRIYVTANEEYESDSNIVTRVRTSYPNSRIESLERIFEEEEEIRLVNFLNIPPLQSPLKLMNHFELARRQLFFLLSRQPLSFKLQRHCLQALGVGFNHPRTTIIARNVCIDRMAPNLIFIDDCAVIGARTILQSHGIKSDKGYGPCYSIGPIYIMGGADIGSDCIVLPGSIIGKGCAAYPMTLIKKDISPVFVKGEQYPVTYNQIEEYPYRLNFSLTQAKALGLAGSVYFKNLKGKIILAQEE